MGRPRAQIRSAKGEGQRDARGGATHGSPLQDPDFEGQSRTPSTSTLRPPLPRRDAKYIDCVKMRVTHCQAITMTIE